MCLFTSNLSEVRFAEVKEGTRETRSLKQGEEEFCFEHEMKSHKGEMRQATLSTTRGIDLVNNYTPEESSRPGTQWAERWLDLWGR